MQRKKPLRRRTRLRSSSPKRAAQLREYSKERINYLQQHDRCECCAMRTATDIHHIAGRRGAKLLDKKDWMAVCRICHEGIHNNPKTARKQGLLK